MSKKFSSIVSTCFMLLILWHSPIEVHSQSEAVRIENNIVVTFQPHQSPAELRDTIAQDRTQSQGMLGTIQDIFMEILQGDKITKANQRLKNIQQLEKTLNISHSYRLFDSVDSSLDDTYIYVYILDGSVSVDKAVTLFEELPEVAYAQPYYLYETTPAN